MVVQITLTSPHISTWITNGVSVQRTMYDDTFNQRTSTNDDKLVCVCVRYRLYQMHEFNDLQTVESSVGGVTVHSKSFSLNSIQIRWASFDVLINGVISPHVLPHSRKSSTFSVSVKCVRVYFLSRVCQICWISTFVANSYLDSLLTIKLISYQIGTEIEWE